MSNPNLFIIGAQKAGTTSLSDILSRHKDISVPPEKELNHFDKPNWKDNTEKYLQRYSSRSNFKYRLDATPGYLIKRNNTNPASNIHEFCKNDPKFFCLLRHPVRRAVAAFYHHFRMGRINTNDKIRDFSCSPMLIVETGFYTQHLGEYINLFGHENVKMLIFEHYVLESEQYHSSIFEWLGLEKLELAKKSEKVNTNAGIKLIYSGDCIQVRDPETQLSELRQSNPYFKNMRLIPPPTVDQKDIDYLNTVYCDEIKKIKKFHPMASDWEDEINLKTFFCKK